VNHYVETVVAQTHIEQSDVENSTYTFSKVDISSTPKIDPLIISNDESMKKIYEPSANAKMAATVEACYWDIVELGGTKALPHNVGAAALGASGAFEGFITNQKSRNSNSSMHRREVFVEYGNDQDSREVGSGFPRASDTLWKDLLPTNSNTNSVTLNPTVKEATLLQEGLPSKVVPRFDDVSYYFECPWNLNNLPFLRPSLLRHVNEEINGINVPWLYLGMLFASFAWHNEDHHLYSVNYMHSGEGKTWYGIPGLYAPEFERVMRTSQEDKQRDADFLYQLTTMLSPATLLAAHVPVFRLFQEPGEFVITMPAAYHSGFSHGFNMAEACNFALPDWLIPGRRAVERYRNAAAPRNMCFSQEQLLFNIARHAKDHSAQAFRLIADELSQLVAMEVRERAAVERDGISTAIALPNESDPRYECIRCRHICYLSAIICRCATGSRKQVSCLRHHKHLCSCPPSSKVLVYWYKMNDLQALVKTVIDMVNSSIVV
jgi:JmjC domain, hydroxylase/C5HC2 zinc finger